MKRLLLLLPCILLVAACSTDSEITKPATPEANSYTRKGELVSLEQRIALGDHISADWWKLFASRPLNNLIHTVVSNNYDLAAARETLAQAQEAIKASNGRLLPQASLGVVAGRQKYGAALFGPANFTIPPFTYYEAGPSLSWTPDLFGGQHHAIELEQALADYQSNQLEAVYLELTGETVATSLEIASTLAEISAVRGILDADQNTLKLVLAAYDLGSASKMDVLSAQARWLSDRALLPPLEQRLIAARHQLAVLAGKAPVDWIPPDFALQDFQLPKTLPVAFPSELARRRPDILAAEANLHAASAALGVASSNLYPSITLTANMMQEALTPAGIFKSTATAWSVAAGLSAPLFSGGTLTAQKREAEHAYQAALSSYRQTILNAFGNVADALTALDKDSESVAIMQRAADTAHDASGIALASYMEGAVGLLQVQDSQRTLANAQLDLVRAQHQRSLDCIRLFVALGGSPLTK